MRIVVFITVIVVALMGLFAFDIMLVSDTHTHIIEYDKKTGQPVKPK